MTGPINLGNPAEFTILEIAQKIIELTGSRSKIVHLPLPEDDPKQRRPDIGAAERILGWRPTMISKMGYRGQSPISVKRAAKLVKAIFYS